MGGPGLVLTFDYGSFSSSCRVVWLTSSSRVDSAICGSSIHHAQRLWSRKAPVDFFSSLLGKWEGHSTPFRTPYRLRWSCSRFSRSALCTDVSFAGGEGFGFVGYGGWVGFTGFGFDMFNSPLKSDDFRLRPEFKPSLFTSDHL